MLTGLVQWVSRLHTQSHLQRRGREGREEGEEERPLSAMCFLLLVEIAAPLERGQSILPHLTLITSLKGSFYKYSWTGARHSNCGSVVCMWRHTRVCNKVLNSQFGLRICLPLDIWFLWLCPPVITCIITRCFSDMGQGSAENTITHGQTELGSLQRAQENLPG